MATGLIVAGILLFLLASVGLYQHARRQSRGWAFGVVVFPPFTFAHYVSNWYDTRNLAILHLCSVGLVAGGFYSAHYQAQQLHLDASYKAQIEKLAEPPEPSWNETIDPVESYDKVMARDVALRYVQSRMEGVADISISNETLYTHNAEEFAAVKASMTLPDGNKHGLLVEMIKVQGSWRIASADEKARLAQYRARASSKPRETKAGAQPSSFVFSGQDYGTLKNQRVVVTLQDDSHREGLVADVDDKRLTLTQRVSDADGMGTMSAYVKLEDVKVISVLR